MLPWIWDSNPGPFIYYIYKDSIREVPGGTFFDVKIALFSYCAIATIGSINNFACFFIKEGQSDRGKIRSE